MLSGEHCQETGEKFHPRKINPVAAEQDTIPGDEMFAGSDAEEGGGGHWADDDLNDLYPGELATCYKSCFQQISRRDLG